jgi:hypothetical protein
MLKNSWNLFLFVVLVVLILFSAVACWFETTSKPILRIDVELDLWGQFHPGGYIQDFKLSITDKFVETNCNVTKVFDYNQPINDFSYLIKFSLNRSSSITSWNCTIDENIDSRGNYEVEVTTCIRAEGSYTFTVEIIAYEGEEAINHHKEFTNIFVF